jgi:hypothetical protein
MGSTRDRDASDRASFVEATPRWLRVVTGYGVLLTVVLQANLPGLMRATGAPGAALAACAFLPLYVAAARVGFAPFRSGVPRAFALLVASLTPSLLWSEHALDGAIKLSAVGTTLAWISLFTAHPGLVHVALRVGLGCCVGATAARALGLGFVPAPSSLFILFVLLAAALRWRGQISGGRLVTRAARVAAMVFLVALVFASSFRAPTLGALLVLGAFAWRSREAAVALAIAAVAAAVFFSIEGPRRAPSYSPVVERSDLVGRYQSISDDRLSGRADIWQGIADEVRTSPAWLYTGAGLGDVDFIVAAANPHVMSFNIRGERVLSPHNLALEVLVAAGLPGTIALLWLLASLAARLGHHPLDAGMLLCLVVVSGSNVPIFDSSGGGPGVALLCAHFGGLAVTLRLPSVGARRRAPG